jgi:hypothetical protein
VSRGAVIKSVSNWHGVNIMVNAPARTTARQNMP